MKFNFRVPGLKENTTFLCKLGHAVSNNNFGMWTLHYKLKVKRSDKMHIWDPTLKAEEGRRGKRLRDELALKRSVAKMQFIH